MNESLLVETKELWEAVDKAGYAQEAPHAGFLVVDTRGRPDFEAAHIPGAVNLPSGDLFDSGTVGSDLLPTEEIERRVSAAGIGNDTRLILYDESGLVPSARVFWVLEHLGRSSMALLNGGFPRWKNEQLPVESGPPQPGPATFRATETAASLAERDDVLHAIQRPDTVIIDTRTPDEYYGRTGAHLRNGHIPGAINVDWQRHIVDLFNPTLVSRSELASLYEQAGVTETTPVITYCRTASRSSHTYFVLRLLGYRNVKNYSGSWMEWSADESLPIE
ncbi:MAG: sulfurtransferase [Spirochaetota bacterium]